jgi:galactokinase
MEDNKITMKIVEKLDEIYIDVENSIKNVHEKRFASLKERFKQIYGHAPKYFCRAPGRVNMIGEHIDYCGYSVLPAAIEQDMIMAYSPIQDDKIIINNVDKD